MAKKIEAAAAKKAKTPAEPAVKTTRARNTDVPPKAKSVVKPTTVKPSAVKASASPAKGTPAAGAKGTPAVTHEMIAERAYHLWRSDAPGGQDGHWAQAERELRGGR